MLLFDSISQHISLTETEQETLLSLFEQKKVPAKSKLIVQGEKCCNLYFILSGILRGYNVDSKGNEHTIQFAKTGWWISDISSLLNNPKAETTIESITESEVLEISYENKQAMFEKIPKMERYFRIITEGAYVSFQKRILFKLSYTAEENYKAFLEKFGNLELHIPQKYVASYIGVTPEFFSKMKSNSYKKS